MGRERSGTDPDLRYRGGMPTLTRRLAAVGIVLAAVTATASAQTIFVDASLTTGANDGSSWSDAFQGGDGLRSALAAATPGTEIWATGGVYRSLPGAAEAFTVQAEDVSLLGGFAGGEASVFERPEVGAFPTVLSGDALGDDDGTPASLVDNAMTVLLCELQLGWTMERVHVVAARGIGFSALESNVDVRDCSFMRCGSAGAALRRSFPLLALALSGRIVDSRFALNGGGGLNYVGNPEFSAPQTIAIDRCVFEHNDQYGLSFQSTFAGTLTVANSVMRSNVGSGARLVEVFSANSMILHRCTIVGNTGEGIEYVGSCGLCPLASTQDCIVWDNASGITSPFVIQSGGLIQDTPATASLVTDDIFEDYASGDLRPAANSPAIDRGVTDPRSTSADPLDVFRGRRVFDDPSVPDGGTPSAWADIGALERSPFLGVYGNCDPTPNSTGSAGRIAATGSVDVAAGDLTLVASSLPAWQFGIFLASRSAGNTPPWPRVPGPCASGGTSAASTSRARSCPPGPWGPSPWPST